MSGFSGGYPNRSELLERIAALELENGNISGELRKTKTAHEEFKLRLNIVRNAVSEVLVSWSTALGPTITDYDMVQQTQDHVDKLNKATTKLRNDNTIQSDLIRSILIRWNEAVGTPVLDIDLAEPGAVRVERLYSVTKTAVTARANVSRMYDEVRRRCELLEQECNELKTEIETAQHNTEVAQQLLASANGELSTRNATVAELQHKIKVVQGERDAQHSTAMAAMLKQREILQAWADAVSWPRTKLPDGADPAVVMLRTVTARASDQKDGPHPGPQARRFLDEWKEALGMYLTKGFGDDMTVEAALNELRVATATVVWKANELIDIRADRDKLRSRVDTVEARQRLSLRKLASLEARLHEATTPRYSKQLPSVLVVNDQFIEMKEAELAREARIIDCHNHHVDVHIELEDAIVADRRQKLSQYLSTMSHELEAMRVAEDDVDAEQDDAATDGAAEALELADTLEAERGDST